MLNTFAFSVDNILRSVYAYAALDSFITRGERPAVLGRDQEAALRQLIYGCAADVVLRLAPAAIASSLDSNHDRDIITVDFDIPDMPGRELIRPAIETILAAMTVAVAWGNVNPGLAAVYTRIATSGFERLQSILPRAGKPEPIQGAM